MTQPQPIQIWALHVPSGPVAECGDWARGQETARALSTIGGGATYRVTDATGAHDPAEYACGLALPAAHTCHTGPLCAYWHSHHDHIEDPGGCIHESCMLLTNEFCAACYSADLDGTPGTCPLHGAEITASGEYSGYAGGRCTYVTYGCGCAGGDDSADVRAAR